MNMKTFQPSLLSYGADAASDADDSTSESTSASLPSSDIVSAARTFFFGEDAREQAEVLKVQIANLEAAAAKQSNTVFRNLYLNQAAKLKAKLLSLEEQAAEAKYAAMTTAVAKTALAVGAVIGVFVVGGMAINQFQRTKIQRLEIERLRSAE